MKIQYFPEEFQKPAKYVTPSYSRNMNPSYPVLLVKLGFDYDYTRNEIYLRCPEKIIYTLTSKEILSLSRILPICIVDTITREQSLNNMSKEGRFYIRKTDSTTWDKAVWPIKIQHFATTPGIIESYSLAYNILEHIKIPLTSGRYEIYCERSGVESNHCFVDIIVEITDTVVNDL